MKNKNDTRFLRESLEWFTKTSFTGEHLKFFNAYKDDFVISDENSGAQPEQLSLAFPVAENYREIINLRVNVYKRNYKAAYEIFSKDVQSFPLTERMLSDIGKACLYGSGEYFTNARLIDGLSSRMKDDPAVFYAYFYAGRLYEKAGNYVTLASNRYKAAMGAAASDENYDNALWYLLNLDLRSSTDKGVSSFKKYCKIWHNGSYFDDLLDILAPLLLSEGKWEDFYELYTALDGYASDEAVAKYAYIYGRLIQEKIAIPTIGQNDGSEGDAAFTRALTSGSALYYRVMAASRLGLAGENAEEVLCFTKVNTEQEIDKDAEILLSGYAAFGFPEKIYSEYSYFLDKKINISFDTAIKISQFLKDCGSDRNEYYPQSLRIASRAISRSNHPLVKDDLRLFFPQDYSRFISESAGKYEIPESVLYALIRSESFFNAEVHSSAGAIGLTQLMEPTAADIAKKLKKNDFSLYDAETNVQFGAFYIEEMYRRLDKHWIPAFFAYNAGITRVRQWIKNSSISFNNRRSVPMDLVLEILPYEETREYGRKLVSAAAFYGWLYEDKSVSETVDMLEK